MSRRPSHALMALFALLLTAATAAAEWPYRTEEAANLPEGHYSLSLGVGRTDRKAEVRFNGQELLTAPAAVYWAIPEVQGTLGVGSRAEVSFDYEYFLYRLHDRAGDQYDSGDLRLWAKLGVVRGRRQALSLRFGVKLPNSTYLGTNEADFFVAGLYDLHLGGWLATANLGLGVLGNPSHNRSQDDLITWGASLRWQGEGGGLQGGVEVAGSNGPYGVERQRDARLYAGVLGWQWEHWRLDGTLRYGVHDWEGWGWLVGVTYDR
ncbi:MAG: hypothetical protein P1P84_12965 [Deferrisomatales bacterium]|nr:hypothetical protein [Deferrisomatales bacterium]